MYHVLAYDPAGGCSILRWTLTVIPDSDGDGSPDPEACAPHDPDLHPGAIDLPGNLIDEDCDGTRGSLRST